MVQCSEDSAVHLKLYSGYGASFAEVGPIYIDVKYHQWEHMYLADTLCRAFIHEMYASSYMNIRS